MTIDTSFKIVGMQEAMQNMEDMLPTLDGVKKAKTRRAILHSAMRPGTKEIAKAASAIVRQRSGALADAIDVRVQGIKRLRRKNARAHKGVFAGLQVAPIRDRPSALATYSNYYNRPSVLESGIRHGHLIEFGHKARDGSWVPAYPFMVPAMFAKVAALRKRFAAELNKTIKRRLRVARRKNKPKRSRATKAPARLVLRIR